MMPRTTFFRRAIPLAAALIASTAPAIAATPSSLTGNWARDDGGTRITIAPCGQNYCAVNTWVKNPAGRERVGDKLVLTFNSVSAAAFKGEAYDVRRRKSFSMTITLQAASMHTSGCVLWGVICKSADWTRVN